MPDPRELSWMRRWIITLVIIGLFQLFVFGCIIYEEQFSQHRSRLGMYEPDKQSYTVYITGDWYEDLDSEYHEACHAQIAKDYYHFCVEYYE